MNLKEYSRYDATGLAELVRRGEVSPQELAATAGRAIDKVNPKLNALVTVYDDRIEQLDEKTLPSGPFRGVPFLMKSVAGDEKGRPKGNIGSRLLHHPQPPAEYDIDVVSRFKQAGLNLIGQTIMPELGATMTVETNHQGITRNPWNPDYMAGGSSTGAAVAVAAGIVPMAHANDAGGSTRAPASCNGVVGLKCSRGRVSLGPGASEITAPFAYQFAETRSVRDMAALLDAIHGPAAGSSVMYPNVKTPFLAEMRKDTGKLRIALSHRGWDKPAHPEVINQLEKVAKQLEGMGHHVEEATPAIDFSEYRNCFSLMYYMGIKMGVEGIAKMAGKPVDESAASAIILKATREYKLPSVEEYLGTMSLTDKFTRILGEFFQRYDVILTPTLAQPVYPLGYLSFEQTDISMEEYSDRLFGSSQFLQLANLTGIPAVSLPLCQTSNGLPLGAHFMAPMGEDALLIRIAAAMEQAMPWRNRLPAVHVSNA